MSDHVLLLSWEYPPVIEGGLARHVRKLAEALVRRGVAVDVLTRGSGERSQGSKRRDAHVPVWIVRLFQKCRRDSGTAAAFQDTDKKGALAHVFLFPQEGNDLVIDFFARDIGEGGTG